MEIRVVVSGGWWQKEKRTVLKFTNTRIRSYYNPILCVFAELMLLRGLSLPLWLYYAE